MNTTLKSVQIYTEHGILNFKAEQIAAAAIVPATGAAIVVTKKDDKITRYAGFPVVFHEELSAVEVVSPLAVGV